MWFSSQSLSESASIFLILTTCFFCGIMANFYVNVYIFSRENRPGTVWCPTDLLQRRQGTVRHRTVPGRAPADVFIYRRWTVPVRYVTTQEKILKNRPVPGRLSNSPVMCTSLKSYDVSFICDHSIRLLPKSILRKVLFNPIFCALAPLMMHNRTIGYIFR